MGAPLFRLTATRMASDRASVDKTGTLYFETDNVKHASAELHLTKWGPPLLRLTATRMTSDITSVNKTETPYFQIDNVKAACDRTSVDITGALSLKC